MGTGQKEVGKFLQRSAIRIGGGAVIAIQAIGHKDWLGLSFPKSLELPLLYVLSFVVILCLLFVGVHIIEMFNWPSPKDLIKRVHDNIDLGVNPDSHTTNDVDEQHRP